MNGQWDFGDISPWRYFLVVSLLLALVQTLSTLDLDGDGQGTLSSLIWLVQIPALMLCLIGVHIALLNLRPFQQANSWLQLFISGVVAAIVFAPLALLIDQLLLKEPLQRSISSEILEEFLAIGPPLVVGWLLTNAPWILGYRVQKSNDTNLSQTATANKVMAVRDADEAFGDQQTCNFMQILPTEIRGELVALKAELHYITVITTRGRALILYNLRDAISEAEKSGTDGIQCHRSHWVATRHIEKLEQSGRQGILALSTGDSVPVARSRLTDVKQIVGHLHI